MVQAFGIQHKARVERFYTDFVTAKNKMSSRLPATLEILSPEMRSEVQTAIVEFLTSVKEQNNEFLKLCVRAYAKKVGADLDCDTP
jgi:hypothetical protein